MKKTILFVHGAWVTPKSWDSMRGYFEAAGYECLAPAWPYLDRPAQSLRDSPAPQLATITINDIVDHFATQIRALPEPPILIGHSFGGLIVQMLLDRSLGAAGVAIDPGPPRGVLPSLRAIWSATPVLLTWLGWRRVLRMSFSNFAADFANSLPALDQRAAFAEHIVPAPGRIFFQAALGLGNGVTFSRATRAPLLLVSGEADRTSTTSMARAMYRRHRRSPARTDFATFAGRSHWLIAEPGWEGVAGGIEVWLDSL